MGQSARQRTEMHAAQSEVGIERDHCEAGGRPEADVTVTDAHPPFPMKSFSRYVGIEGGGSRYASATGLLFDDRRARGCEAEQEAGCSL